MSAHTPLNYYANLRISYSGTWWGSSLSYFVGFEDVQSIFHEAIQNVSPFGVSAPITRHGDYVILKLKAEPVQRRGLRYKYLTPTNSRAFIGHWPKHLFNDQADKAHEKEE